MKCPLRFSETGGTLRGRKEYPWGTTEEALVDAEGFVVCSAGSADGEYSPTWDRKAVEELVAMAAFAADTMAAVLEEREACAKIADEMGDEGMRVARMIRDRRMP